MLDVSKGAGSEQAQRRGAASLSLASAAQRDVFSDQGSLLIQKKLRSVCKPSHLVIYPLRAPPSAALCESLPRRLSTRASCSLLRPAHSPSRRADMQALSAPASSAPACLRRRANADRRSGRRRHQPGVAASAPAAPLRPPSLLLRAVAANHSGSNKSETLLLDLHDQLVPYESAWDWQKRYVDHMCAAKIAALSEAAAPAAAAKKMPLPLPPRDALLLLQHAPVYTLGAGATPDHLRFDPERPPFPLHRVERGGEVTYHGPGQLVLYPLLDLGRGSEGAGAEEVAAAATATETAPAASPRPDSSSSSKNTQPQDPPSWSPRSRDLHWYLRSLEEVVIRALWRASRLKGERVEGLTGVWVGGAKVAAVGVRARSWVTYHGVALNVGADLSPFRQIVPCGISDRPVGSVRSALGLPPPPPAANAASAAAAALPPGASPAELAAAVAAARDPLLAEYRDALLESFQEVFDARFLRVGAHGEGVASDDEAALGPPPQQIERAAAAVTAAA
jgi:lipoyl(octanoyl) transferase